MRVREFVRPLWWVLFAALTVGCGGGPASSAGPTSTPTTRPPATASTATTSTVLSPAAVPAPVLEAAEPSRPVAPPAGSPSATIRRDCGMSTALSNGRTLWIYCDTALFGTDERLEYFVNTSAAVATPDAPTVMVDNVDPDGHPLTFLRPEDDYPRCSSEEKRALWPQSAVTILATDAQPRDRVLVWYSNVCLVPGGAQTSDIGLAEAWFDVGPGASAAPTSVDILDARLLPKLGAAGGYGVASVIDGPDAYLYWCGQDTEPCRIARVALDRVADPTAYRYYDGADWVPDATAARPLAMGESRLRIKASVQWVAPLDRYVMADVDAWNHVSLRVAPRPEGPWSAPATVTLPGCAEAFPDNCFAVEVQPQLSDAAHVAVSYFDPVRPYGNEPTTRVVDIPITLAR